MISNKGDPPTGGSGPHAAGVPGTERVETLASSEQTEQLLRAITGIGAHLDITSTLESVVAEAMKLTGCRYGAVATRDADGKVNYFVNSGRSTETPTGKGLIAVVWSQSSPVRLENLSAHPAAAQAPEDFPGMCAFLGVPIMLQGKVFGGLFLADDRPGWVFSESHEVAVRVFASAAAVAVDNARLFERSERRAEWLLSSRGVITELLLGAQSTRLPLQLIATELQKLAHAEQAIVLTPSDTDLPPDEIETLIVSAAVGVHADQVIGQEIPVDRSTTGHVFRTGQPLITESFRYPIPAFTDAGERSAIVMPLRYERTVKGVIAVARGRSETPFDSSYLDLVGDFASHAALALALAANSQNSLDLSILADRERIAHDLHDYVIQRLFAIGLDVQGTIARARSPELVARLDRTIDDLQSTIEDIRNTIFELQSPATDDGGFRRRIQQTVAGMTENREITTTLHMSGPMTAVDPQLAQHAEAVVAEAVSNAVRHSGAKHVNIQISVADDLCIDVVDDGCGIPEKNQRRSGLANLHRRAEQVGGVCTIGTPAAGGTAIHWAAPLVD